jgi:ABC-2 type transport system ATP-binding protein
LDIQGLHKSFARPSAVDLSLSVALGEFYALLGPNRAEKTTTLRMVAGLLKPDAEQSRSSE